MTDTTPAAERNPRLRLGGIACIVLWALVSPLGVPALLDAYFTPIFAQAGGTLPWVTRALYWLPQEGVWVCGLGAMCGIVALQVDHWDYAYFHRRASWFVGAALAAWVLLHLLGLGVPLLLIASATG